MANAGGTCDKYVPFIHKDGQDEHLADEICAEEKSIEKKVHGFRLPPKEDVPELIALIAEANYDKQLPALLSPDAEACRTVCNRELYQET